MLFNEKKQEKRLNHILKKYEEKVNSRSRQGLSIIPKNEYWRLFIDGIDQQSARGIQKAFIRLHGEEMLADEEFLSMTINEYLIKYNKKKKYYFIKGGKKKTIHQFLQYQLFLDPHKYKKFLSSRLRNGEATIKEVLQLDQAWLAYEVNEPHYLYSVFETFFTISHLDEQLSLDHIKNLHALLGANVRGTNYENPEIRPGNIREISGPAYGLAKQNTSIDGIKEMLHRRNDSNTFMINLYDKLNHTYCGIALNQDAIANARKHHVVSNFFRIGEDDHINELLLNPEKNPLDAALLEIFSKIISTKSSRELAPIIYSLITGSFEFPNQNIYCQMQYGYGAPADNTQSFYENELQRCIDEYYTKMSSARSPLEKLRAIVSFAQQCEQLHPFYDMNCRLFNMVILNHLLSQNGFPYVVQENPNRFDLYSINELIDDMITGMKKTLELMDNKAIYGIDTKNLLKELKSSPTHQSTFYADFKEALKLADNHSNKPTQPKRSLSKHKN